MSGIFSYVGKSVLRIISFRNHLGWKALKHLKIEMSFACRRQRWRNPLVGKYLMFTSFFNICNACRNKNQMALYHEQVRFCSVSVLFFVLWICRSPFFVSRSNRGNREIQTWGLSYSHIWILSCGRVSTLRNIEKSFRIIEKRCSCMVLIENPMSKIVP